MIQRIVHTVLTLICMSVVTTQTHAGVITVVNDIVTKATLNNGTTNINVQFVNASYNTLTTGSNPVDVMPWFGTESQAQALGEDLRDSINNYESGAGADELIPFSWYLFSFARTTSEPDADVESIAVYDGSEWIVHDSAWLTGPNSTIAMSPPPSPAYYAILDTGGDGSVPEPSTAIAMGLLGIVGFAGNRRRRRQASVA